MNQRMATAILIYANEASKNISCIRIFQQLSHHFVEDLLELSSPGVANLVVFRRKTFGPLNLVPSGDFVN